MKKVGILGHFAFNTEKNDGQTVKTRELFNELKKHREYNITTQDTYNYKKNPFKFLINCILLLKKNDYVILVVASGGSKVLIPFYSLFNIFFKRKIAYCVVGSWLYDRIKSNYLLKICCKKIDCIFVETENLKSNLEKVGYTNVIKMYNFKEIDKISKINHRIDNSFCIFSRIMKEKGIEDAIQCINELNMNNIKCHLYIYGPISEFYIQQFNKLIDNSKKNVTYMGSVDTHRSLEIISKYWMLLFPTRYINEGLPGTLIDAYKSSTPVISANWNSACEFVNDNIGYVFEFLNISDLYNKMKYCLLHKDEVESKRKNAYNFSKKFSPEIAIEPLLNFLEDNL